MAALWLQNLAFYSLQIGVLALTGALLLRVLQIRMPAIRTVMWQLLIAVCLALPAVEPWLTAKSNAQVQITLGPARSGDASHGSRGIRLPLADIALAVIASGIAIRFGILALGVWRLRRYRRDSKFAPNAFLDMQQRLGVFADVQVSADVSGRVTFGFLRPTILVPEACLDDQSIACHELSARPPTRLAFYRCRRVHPIGVLVPSRHVVDDGANSIGARRNRGSRSGGDSQLARALPRVAACIGRIASGSRSRPGISVLTQTPFTKTHHFVAQGGFHVSISIDFVARWIRRRARSRRLDGCSIVPA